MLFMFAQWNFSCAHRWLFGTDSKFSFTFSKSWKENEHKSESQEQAREEHKILM